MSTKFGFPALTNRATNLNKPKNFSGGKTLPLIVRVIDIVLDENHPLIKNGSIGLNSLGMILGAGTKPNNFGKIYKALPSNPNTKKYPIINEHVELFQSTTPNSNGPQFFYQESLGLFGTSTPNGNQFPSITQNITPPSQNLNYSQIETGASNIVDNQTQTLLSSPIDNPSQANFVVQSNIQPLMPFEGHIMYEGRFGNSLRFGSTAKSLSLYANNWSSIGNNGDPITILRNGQPSNSTSEGWIPLSEDINNDLSLIYLTSYQKIPINLAREEFKIKWKTPPITPTTYINPQVIINSDRVIINSKKDSIFLSAQQSIGLSCYDEINIIGKNIILDGTKVYLGDKSATQPVLKGDDTVILLKQVVTEIRNLAMSLETSMIFPAGVPLPNVVIQSTSQIAIQNLNKILIRLEDNVNGIKSNFVKVK